MFSKVIDVEGASADQIYSCVQSVIPSLMHKDERKSKVSVSGIGGFSGGIAGFGSETTIHVKDLNSMVLIENAEYNTITIRSWLDCSFKRSRPFKVWFTMRVECKDNRYKIYIYDFIAKKPPGHGGMKFTQNTILYLGIKENNELKGPWGISMSAFCVVASQITNTMQTQIETITCVESSIPIR